MRDAPFEGRFTGGDELLLRLVDSVQVLYDYLFIHLLLLYLQSGFLGLAGEDFCLTDKEHLALVSLIQAVRRQCKVLGQLKQVSLYLLQLAGLLLIPHDQFESFRAHAFARIRRPCCGCRSLIIEHLL